MLLYKIHRITQPNNNKKMFGTRKARTDFHRIRRANSKYENSFPLTAIIFAHAQAATHHHLPYLQSKLIVAEGSCLFSVKRVCLRSPWVVQEREAIYCITVINVVEGMASSCVNHLLIKKLC